MARTVGRSCLGFKQGENKRNRKEGSNRWRWRRLRAEHEWRLDPKPAMTPLTFLLSPILAAAEIISSMVGSTEEKEGRGGWADDAGVGVEGEATARQVVKRSQRWNSTEWQKEGCMHHLETRRCLCTLAPPQLGSGL